MDNRKSQSVTVLGGGLAGLFAAYHLKQAGFPVTVYEKKAGLGGNCVTFASGDFRFDSGAHRFHDKDSESTETIKTLLGDRLRLTHKPSRVYSRGRLVDFPLSTLSLLRSLGILGFARSTYEIVRSRLERSGEPEDDLRGYATRNYGSAIAERFLLNYSEKLWGVAPERLSSRMVRVRLKGLTVQGFLKEAIRGARSKAEHLDGSFYYPDRGIGAIADAVSEAVGSESVHRDSEVTGIVHDGDRVRSIVLNGTDQVEVDRVISTIPLPHLLAVMDPRPEEAVMAPARTLRYRNLILVALLLRKQSVTADAVVYFPEKDFVFTRAYEPRNRSKHMAPPGLTSLVLEVPCDPGDRFWEMDNGRLADLVRSQLSATAWVKPDDIIGTEVRRMECAYPVVDLDTPGVTDRLLGFLEGFSNLTVSGRNGRFAYCSIHEIMMESRKVAGAYMAGTAEATRVADMPAT